MTPTILIIEDCKDLAWILARFLRDAGYRVLVAYDGAHGLALVERERPDCVVLDLMMPVMSGIEVLQRLRHGPATATLPVVLVSARVGQGRTHMLAEGDADYCVAKPFTRAQVLYAVSMALGRHVPEAMRAAGAAV